MYQLVCLLGSNPTGKHLDTWVKPLSQHATDIWYAGVAGRELKHH